MTVMGTYRPLYMTNTPLTLPTHAQMWNFNRVSSDATMTDHNSIATPVDMMDRDHPVGEAAALPACSMKCGNVAALGSNAVGVVVAWAIQDYGAVVVDSYGADKGVILCQGESTPATSALLGQTADNGRTLGTIGQQMRLVTDNLPDTPKGGAPGFDDPPTPTAAATPRARCDAVHQGLRQERPGRPGPGDDPHRPAVPADRCAVGTTVAVRHVHLGRSVAVPVRGRHHRHVRLERPRTTRQRTALRAPVAHHAGRRLERRAAAAHPGRQPGHRSRLVPRGALHRRRHQAGRERPTEPEPPVEDDGPKGACAVTGPAQSCRVRVDVSTLIRARVWPTGTAEPSTWECNADFASRAVSGSGDVIHRMVSGCKAA